MAEQRKGPGTEKDAPAREGRGQEERERKAADADQDTREDEGWSQPESSAQKTPPEP